jgi:hypothetical protein
LNMIGSKLDTIEAAIANFLPRLTPVDLRRWRGIKEAVDRVRILDTTAGLSGDTFRIDMSSLERTASDTGDAEFMDVDQGGSEAGEGDEADEGDEAGEGEGDDDFKGSEHKVTSPVRRSSRRPKVAEKLRLATGADEDDEEEGGYDNDEKFGDEDADDFRKVRGKGVDSSEGPREKKKSAYLTYDAGVHFYWDQAVCCIDLGGLMPTDVFFKCRYCTDGNWICFGDVYLVNGKLSSQTKCQSCVILRKPCTEGVRGAHPVATIIPAGPGAAFVRAPVVNPSPKPPVLRLSSKVPATSSSAAPASSVIDLTNPSVSRKRSALGPPSSAAPSSSKVLRATPSMSAIRHSSSMASSSPSIPSPLVFSTSLPSPLAGSSSAMVIDPSEDHMLLLLDALEFAIDKGNLDDARMRIQALRKFRQQEKRYRGA